MNILHIISSVDPAVGGPIEAINQFAAVMKTSGHHSEVASLDSPDAACVRESPVPVHALGPGRLRYGFSERFIPWLRTSHARYDAVVVHGLWQYHSFATWRVLRKAGRPYVLFTHGMLDPWFKKRYPLKHVKKWLYWPWAEYRVLRDAHATLFTCEEERERARQSFSLYRCNERIVNYGTDGPRGNPHLHRQDFFGRFPGLRGKRLALFLGRIHPKKGCDLVIEAFARVLAQDREWHLVIAGPDQVGMQKDLMRLAERLAISSRITWAGMISGDAKWGAFGAAEIFLLPSHQENLGIAVTEALASGLPVLISNKVNIWREISVDGGGIVSDDTLEGTCAALRSYLDLPEAKRRAMGQAARSCFESRFAIKAAAEKLHNLLTEVTGVDSPGVNSRYV